MAIYSEFSHEKWPFSIVMLVYQRVLCLITTATMWKRETQFLAPVAAPDFRTKQVTNVVTIPSHHKQKNPTFINIH